MKIKYTKRFAKQYDKVDIKIQNTFKKRLKLFISDPLQPQLRNHPLKGSLEGYRSINITGDWRAIFSEEVIDEEKVIIFEMLGTHSQLYK